METTKVQLNRREFFSALTVGWIVFGAAVSGLLGLIFRYTFPNVRFEPDMDVFLGKPEDLPPGVYEGAKNNHGIWIVKHEGKIFALSNICTHLGCIPNWTPATQTFECPCHGSGYYISGINFKGAAPRPLERYGVRLLPDGNIQVQKNKVFRYEKDQWGLEGSYLEV